MEPRVGSSMGPCERDGPGCPPWLSYVIGGPCGCPMKIRRLEDDMAFPGQGRARDTWWKDGPRALTNILPCSQALSLTNVTLQNDGDLGEQCFMKKGETEKRCPSGLGQHQSGSPVAVSSKEQSWPFKYSMAVTLVYRGLPLWK